VSQNQNQSQKLTADSFLARHRPGAWTGAVTDPEQAGD
jgi:hypothetical protein